MIEGYASRILQGLLYVPSYYCIARVHDNIPLLALTTSRDIESVILKWEGEWYNMLSSIPYMPLLEGKCKRYMKSSSRLDDWWKQAPNDAKVVEKELGYYYIFLRSKGLTITLPTSIIEGEFYMEELEGSVAIEWSVSAFGHGNKALS
jgi:hypothetical protein